MGLVENQTAVNPNINPAFYSAAHLPHPPPPFTLELCEILWARESRHTAKASCFPHLEPFACSMLSASIWTCAFMCVLCLLARQWPVLVREVVCISSFKKNGLCAPLRGIICFCLKLCMWSPTCTVNTTSCHCFFICWIWTIDFNQKVRIRDWNLILIDTRHTT